MTIRFKAHVETKRYVDLTYSQDPVKTHVFLIIENSTPVTLYFKLKISDANWTIDGATEKALGGISPASWSWYLLLLQRPKPTTDTVETVTLKLEAYTDSGYTNLLEYTTLSIDMILEYIEDFTNVTIDDFNDGTYQGWSASAPYGDAYGITNEKSFEAGGYSMYAINPTPSAGWAPEVDMYKSKTIGGTSKARLSLYFAVKANGRYDTSRNYLRRIIILVDGVEKYRLGHDTVNLIGYTGAGVRSFGWYNIAIDLTPYIGSTRTIHVKIYHIEYKEWNIKFYLDHVVWAWD